MRDIKCADCDNYHNEWCNKIIDSPYPDMLRDCSYFCKKRDLVEVVRCKDCKWRGTIGCAVDVVDESDKVEDNDFCSWGEE